MKKLVILVLSVGIFFGCLLASPKASAKGSKNYEKLVLDKKANLAQITNPAYFDESLNETFAISDHSDMNGVCLHFGFEEAVENKTAECNADQLAVIDSSGEVNSYYGNDNPKENRRITVITCVIKKKN